MSIPTTLILSSKKFRLRIPDETDLEFVFSTAEYPGVHDGMLWEPPQNREELIKPLERSLKRWQEGSSYNFTIETKDQNPIQVGRISIRKTETKDIWNVGFWTHPKYQRKGVMSEALKAVTNFGFTKLKAKEITAQYAIWNKASEKVLLNNNFKFVRHLEKGYFKNGKWESENEFALKKNEIGDEKNTSASQSDFRAILKENKNTIFENDFIIILLDIDPISLGHVIICPKDHYRDFHGLPDQVMYEMMKWAKKYIKLLEKVFENEGYSMMLNAGSFNDLNHCHLHIFPRKSAKEFQWTYDEENLPEDATRFDVLKKLFEGNL